LKPHTHAYAHQASLGKTAKPLWQARVAVILASTVAPAYQQTVNIHVYAQPDIQVCEI